MKRYFIIILFFVCASSVVVNAQKKSKLEKHLESIGLMNVAEHVPGVDVYMVYSTPYNFMGRVLYEGLDEAYLVPEAIEKLNAAQELLRRKRLDLHLIVYDAARPRSVQAQMWSIVEGTDMEDYVANPHKSGGGPHNYGIAVDVTLVDCTGHPLPMGSEYDFFGDRARVDKEPELLKSGQITDRELENRKLLREVMVEAGWIVEPAEWWHFGIMPTKKAREILSVIE